MNLGNLKAGKTTTVEGLDITKGDGHYDLGYSGEAWTLTYDKDEKAWVLARGNGHTITFKDATAKTIVFTVLDTIKAILAADEQAEAEEAEKPAETDEEKAARKREGILDKIAAAMKIAQDPSSSDEQAEAALAAVARLMDRHSVSEEELRRRKATEAGLEHGDEEIVDWTYPINVQGGHAPHRVAAFASVVTAMGARCFYLHHKVKGAGYKADTMVLRVFAQQSIIDNLKAFLPVVELQMERLGDEVSRKKSREAREAGGHHSGPGCHARRGFMRGFGAGIAFRITEGREEMETEDGTGSTALVLRDRATVLDQYMAENHGNLKSTKAQKYDDAAYRQGHAAGVAFASPQVATEPAAKVLQDA
jgi:hypothetical protein